jgi:hypothetical protein
MIRPRLHFLAIALFAAALFANDSPANLSGTWVLDANQSKWGNHGRPTSIVINIAHQEPTLKYTGQEIKPGEDEAREFSFDGAIDGKSYPVRGPGEEGSMYYKRVNGHTIDSVFTSKDGTVVEHARTTISNDGKRLTRDVKVNSPAHTESWTEVYVRRQ